ncbi:MAG: alpha-2-macroglobulin family protein, partial [Thermodesulfobacteriota bacterium]
GAWWSGWDQRLSARPDKVTLELDKAAYLPGDVINLTVKPPHSGEAVILVEGGSPLWFKRLPVSAQGTLVEIPVSAAWDSHDIYVSAVVFRPGQALERITPNRAVGLVRLPLDRADRKLSLALEAPEKVSPQKPTPMTAVISLDRKPDGPVFVTLAAVDVGILSITDFATPDPYAWFFSPRRYGVETYDLYGKVIELLDGRAAALKCGGDAEAAETGGQRPETKVKLVTLFSGPVAFDQNGRAEVTLVLPDDFNGRLRLMAVAFGDQAFGSAETEMTVAAPVVTQLSTPRFLAPGDQSLLTLDVHNLSGRDQQLEIGLFAGEPLEIKDGQRTLALKDGEKTSLTFPTAVHDDFGAGLITMRLRGQEVEIDHEWQLGVRPAYPGVTRLVRRVLQPGDEFTLDREIAADLMPSSYQASVKISATLPLNLGDNMRGLIAYPYGCLEQTSSRAFPLLYATSERIVRLDLPPIAQSERLRWLEEAVERLSIMQTSSGGFALWSEGGPEEPWLTAYVTDFFLQARDQGLSVPTPVLDKAFRRLEQYVQNGLEDRGEGKAERQFDFAVRGYAAFVLAKVGRAPLGSLRTFYDQNRQEAGSPLALAHFGLALKLMGDQSRSGEALMEAARKRREEVYYWGDYGGPLRDLALTAALLVEYKVDAPGLDKMLLEVDDALRERRWLSTQEIYALFKLGLALESLAGRRWEGTLNVAGRLTELGQEGAYILHPDLEAVAGGVTVRSRSTGPLFVSAVVSGYTKTPPPEDQSSIRIERKLYDLEGAEIGPLEFKVGDLALVHLAV